MPNLTITHHQIARSSTTLHYWLAGPTDRPLVVFTHGGSMDHRMFEPQLAAVAEQYRVLLWDVHGCGQSQPMGMDGVFSLRTVADDLLAIVDQLGYQEASFVGQSFGAYIPQEIAFLYPERVTALVVIGSFCITMEMSPALRQGLERRGVSDMSPAQYSQFITDMVGIRPEVKAYALEASAQVSQETGLATRKAMPGFFHEEVGYQLPMPFLLTHGAYDALDGIIQQAPVWAQRESHCRYVIIPDAGHAANQDNPEFFNAVLLEFLAQHVP
jgi:3-oxoadipate enol-lactonase